MGGTLEFSGPTEELKPAWRRLYEGYATFYERELTDEIAESVWRWIMDPGHELEAVLVLDEGHPVGLAHYRRIPNPLRGREVGWLDDLFVAPEARGGRIGEKIFGYLREVAAERGWPLIRWVTAEDNDRARNLYDRVGRATTWVLYEMET